MGTLMKQKLSVALLGITALTFGFVGPVSAAPEIPNPPASAQGIENGVGIGCDMGQFHSVTAQAGKIGKNKGHYPGQHRGASVCK